MRVTEVMRSNPICCLPTTSARKAAAEMKQFNTGVLVVVDGLETRKLKGIVTDRDLCIRVLSEDADPAKIMVRDCMTQHLYSCTEQQELTDVLSLMAAHKIRRVPVVNEAGGVTGVITDRDLLENADIDPHALCVALGRITASNIKFPHGFKFSSP